MKRILYIMLAIISVANGLHAEEPDTHVEIDFEEMLDSFSNEPTIEEVRKAAIAYAEVQPEKIAGWRRRANMSAIMPRLNFGIDESKSDTYEIYTSSTKQYVFEGPDKSSTGWDLSLTWDLGDLIWNGAQTLIDVRSKLMVQLREYILSQVNTYYFERRKLQLELISSPPSNVKNRLEIELRIQELAAHLDGLTNGFFTRSIR